MQIHARTRALKAVARQQACRRKGIKNNNNKMKFLL